MKTRTSTRRPPAVVVGLNHYIGLQSARILHAQGLPVWGVSSSRRHPFHTTNACEKRVYGSLSTPKLVEVLLELARDLPEKAVLYPCKDISVLMLSRQREALEPHYHLALPAPDTVETLMHKERFHDLALEQGWPVPATRVFHGEDEALEIAEALPYPCALKPSLKTPSWEAVTHLKAFRVDTPRQLLEHVRRYAEQADTFVAQAWIPGGDDTLYACNGYFDRAGQPAVMFTSRSLRKWRPDTGSTSLGEAVSCPEVEQMTRRVFETVGYRGLGYLEMKRHEETGAFYIMEPNVGRPTGKSALADRSGAPLLGTMYADLTGQPLPARPPAPAGGQKWIYLRHDLQSALVHARRGTLTWKDWRRSIKGKKVYALWSRKDPKPFFADLWFQVKQLLRLPSSS